MFEKAKLLLKIAGIFASRKSDFRTVRVVNFFETLVRGWGREVCELQIALKFLKINHDGYTVMRLIGWEGEPLRPGSYMLCIPAYDTDKFIGVPTRYSRPVNLADQMFASAELVKALYPYYASTTEIVKGDLILLLDGVYLKKLEEI